MLIIWNPKIKQSNWGQAQHRKKKKDEKKKWAVGQSGRQKWGFIYSCNKLAEVKAALKVGSRIRGGLVAS